MYHPRRDHVCFSHDENSLQKGKCGLASLEERAEILTEFENNAFVATESVYLKRIMEGGDPTQEATLAKLKCIRRFYMKTQISGDRILNFAEAVKDHNKLPPSNEDCVGFFPHVSIGKDLQGENRFTLICTTRELIRRWLQASDKCPAHANGGFKYKVLGWLLHVLGLSNPAGEWTTSMYGITSTMEDEHVAEVFDAYVNIFEKVTGRSCAKRESMSDSKKCYRLGFAKAF